MSWITDLISGLAPVAVSAYYQGQQEDATSDATRAAYNMQQASADKAIAAQMAMYNDAVARSEPWRQAGLSALPKTMFYAGVPNSGYSIDPRLQKLNDLYAAYRNTLGPTGGVTIGTGGVGSGTGGSTGGAYNPDAPSFLESLLPAIAKELGTSPDMLSNIPGFQDAFTSLGDSIFGITPRTSPAPVVDAMNPTPTTGPSDPALLEQFGSSGFGTGAFAAAEAAAYDAAIAAGLGEQGAMLAAQNAGLMGTEAAVSNAASLLASGAGTAAASSGLAASMAGMTEAGLTGSLASLGAAPATTSLMGALGPLGAVVGGALLFDSFFDDTHPYYAAYDNGEYVGRQGPEDWEKKLSFDPFGNPVGYDSYAEWSAAHNLSNNQSDIARQALDPVAKILSDMGYDQLRLSYQPNNDEDKPGYYKFALPNTFTTDGKVTVSEIPGGQWGPWSQFYSGGDQSSWDTKALLNSTYGPTIDGQEVYARSPEELVQLYQKYVPLPDPNAPPAPAPVQTTTTKPPISYNSGVTGDTYYLNNMAGITGGA